MHAVPSAWTHFFLCATSLPLPISVGLVFQACNAAPLPPGRHPAPLFHAQHYTWHSAPQWCDDLAPPGGWSPTRTSFVPTVHVPVPLAAGTGLSKHFCPASQLGAVGEHHSYGNRTDLGPKLDAKPSTARRPLPSSTNANVITHFSWGKGNA